MHSPFIEDTLGEKLDAKSGLSVSCLTCRRTVMLDIADLVRRLGRDYSCMPFALTKLLYCRECRESHREDRNLQFTDYAATPKLGPPQVGLAAEMNWEMDALRRASA
ncbi:hypothetical protein MPL3365_200151 [Mesorhizobium plurifarium]|uniref:Uncharacterized protein n=1 Tax=Mesorhizobium plurifarium TaxID=69974 RepID=A0A090G9Z8_MESPL|nr:hypothetical protein MPL3365_200151 [Mesorhizobium plurifarium]